MNYIQENDYIIENKQSKYMKINIKDKIYNLKYGFRSLMIFESIAKKSFEASNVTEILIFMYSCILASDKDCALKFDDFLDYVDSNPHIVNEFSIYLADTFQRMSQINPDEKEEAGEAKNA